MSDPYLPELNELAELALAKIMPEAEGDAIITRGILVMEILRPSDQQRGVIGVQIGRMGSLTPWDVVGLLAPIALKAQGEMAEGLFNFGPDDD